MHRTAFLILVLLLIAVLSLPLHVTGQTKNSNDIDLFRCWSYPLTETPGRRLTTDGSLLFAGLDSGRVDALSLDGGKIWSTEFGGDVTSDMAIIGNSLYLVTSSAGEPDERESTLRSVSKETGVTTWTRPVPSAAWHRLFVYRGSLLVVSETGSIELLDPASGTVIWDRKITRAFSSGPVLAGDHLVLASVSRQLFTISPVSGQIESMRMSENEVTALAAVNGSIYLGDGRGGLSLLENGMDKPRWRFRAGGEVSSVALVDDHLLAVSHDNFVYFIDAARGGLAWKRRLGGRGMFAVDYAGKFLLAAGFDAHTVAVIEPVKGKIAGQIVLGPEETTLSSPVVSNGIIYLITNEAVHAYSPVVCGAKKGGTGN